MACAVELEPAEPATSRAAAPAQGLAGRVRLCTRLCLGKSSKDVLDMVAAELGWKEGAGAGALHFVMQTREAAELLAGLPPRSAVSRYLGMHELCEKGTFTRLVAGQGFPWWPETYIYPEDSEAIEKMMSRKSAVAIVKPEDASQGDGISLVRKVQDLRIAMSVRSGPAVVQRYLAKPLLLGGTKFDLRLYVAVDGLPLRAAVCREGLGRFCTEPYQAPASANLHKVMGHLTNYSLNKRSAGYVHEEAGADVQEADERASKRLLSTVLRQIEEEYPAFCVEAFWEDVDRLVSDCLRVISPVLEATWGEGPCPCFQLLGFDVLLDHKLKPWLLEINNSPSLAIDSVFPWTEASAGKSCLCMDYHGPHEHRTCAVDAQVKTQALRGCLQRAAAHLRGVEVAVEAYVEVPVEVAELERQVVALWRRGGAKTFTSYGLRRALQPALDRGLLSTVDLDLVAQKHRKPVSSKPVLPGPPVGAELGVRAFRALLAAVAARAFGAEADLDKLLAVL